jgi:hypothetical protein
LFFSAAYSFRHQIACYFSLPRTRLCLQHEFPLFSCEAAPRSITLASSSPMGKTFRSMSGIDENAYAVLSPNPFHGTRRKSLARARIYIVGFPFSPPEQAQRGFFGSRGEDSPDNEPSRCVIEPLANGNESLICHDGSRKRRKRRRRG